MFQPIAHMIIISLNIRLFLSETDCKDNTFLFLSPNILGFFFNIFSDMPNNALRHTSKQYTKIFSVFLFSFIYLLHICFFSQKRVQRYILPFYYPNIFIIFFAEKITFFSMHSQVTCYKT